MDAFKFEQETSSEYILRICRNKSQLGITWKELAELVNDELGLNYSSSWYSKNFYKGAFDVCESTENSCSDNCMNCGEQCCGENSKTTEQDSASRKTRELQDKMNKLALKKAEVSDLIVQNNAYIRRLSREQTIIEIASRYAETMSKEKILTMPKIPDLVKRDDKEGILLLSDWHYGMVCDNPWNKFDPDICKKRVNKLLNQTIQLVCHNNIEKMTVMNLSDLIAGRIHTQIRIESRFDVITQIMEVSEILAEFLFNLSSVCDIDYYDCLDNHSRLEPNKKDSLDLESLVRIIPWYLKKRLCDVTSIQIHSNEFGPDIITCNILGHDVIGVHGDHDSPVTGIDKLTLMTHKHYDLFCTAHRHHFHCDEKNHCIIIGNSSLMGTDSYAEKLRLSSDPSQTFIVVTSNNVCESIHRIKLA